jgi:hypothetical protein
MKFNFKKVSALATSALMVGMTVGVAAAAYPAPFVSGGAPSVNIVYGTGEGVSFLDGIEAGNIQADLQRFLTSGTGGTGTSTSGETASLDTSATRIWLNTSLNTAKTQLTKSDLPKVLADYSFSGNVDSKLTSTIKLVAGAAAGGDNSGKVIFSKQPTSSTDPVVGISMGSSQTSNPLYNASVTMSAINFTSSDSEGQPITLFGQKFTISSDTDTSNLVLLKEAEKFSLSSDDPTKEVVIGGKTYTVELISASDDSASIKVTDSNGVSDDREINAADSKKINGLEIAVTSADETNLKVSATLIAGASKITLTNGAVVTTGENADPIDGTYAYIVGGTGAATEIAVAVFRSDPSEDAILPGTSFADPLFGSFKVDFAGLSSSLTDTGRGMVSVEPSGDKDMTVKLTDDAGNAKSFEFAHNQSTQWFLGDSSNYSIATREMANLSTGTSKAKYVVIGNEEYGHLLELTDVYNQTTGSNSVTNDRVKFKDVISGESYETTFVSTEGSGSVDVEGKRYTVTFMGSGEDGWVQIKYPTGDSATSTTFVMYPTIELKGGALISLYQPLVLNMSDMDGGTTALSNTEILNFPDGDGYTAITLTYYSGSDANNALWNVTGQSAGINTTAGTTYKTFTVGKLTYNLTATGTTNETKLWLTSPEGTANIDNPGLIFFEGKGDTSSNDYHAIIVDLETAPAGTSSDGVGVNDLLFSSPTHWEATLATDSDITQHVDLYGTLASYDSNTASKAKATISYPSSQVYSQIYVGEKASAVTAGTSGSSGSTTPLGEVLIKDSEVSSASGRNLIVVGGSCINSAAAALVGGPYCGAAWTDKTGVGSGQFWIKGYATSTITSSGKIALLVAGYNAQDTVNAAKYLRTQTVETDKTYLGTSATSATLVTTAA